MPASDGALLADTRANHWRGIANPHLLGDEEGRRQPDARPAAGGMAGARHSRGQDAAGARLGVAGA